VEQHVYPWTVVSMS